MNDPAPAPRLPMAVRLISRHASELALNGLQMIEQLLPNSGDAGILVISLIRTCLPDWIGPDGPRRPRKLGTTASIHGTAASLNYPYATAHRLIGKLIDMGVVVRVDDRIAISREPAWAPTIVSYLQEAHDLFLRFVSELEVAGQLDHQLYVASRKPAMLAIVATALDSFLLPFEMFSTQIGDWTSKKLWLVISTLCVRHITDDLVLNERYAYASTPNSERRSVPSSVIYGLVGTSTATGWRHCKAMEQAGTITRDDRGLVLCTQELLEARMEASVQGAVAFYRRRVEELMAKGFDPKTLAYFTGPPPLVDYEPLSP